MIEIFKTLADELMVVDKDRVVQDGKKITFPVMGTLVTIIFKDVIVALTISYMIKCHSTYESYVYERFITNAYKSISIVDMSEDDNEGWA